MARELGNQNTNTNGQEITGLADLRKLNLTVGKLRTNSV